jgi:hypothetical protein
LFYWSKLSCWCFSQKLILNPRLKAIRKNDTRLTPDNKPILSRLADICGEMKIDIDECFKGELDSTYRRLMDLSSVL